MKKLCLCLALASLLGLGGQAFALIGTADVVPAATLLLPYFEVSLADCDAGTASGVNTLFSINNASDAAVLSHVTVWSDQSIPVLDFDVYLTGYDVQTINMCDILKNGNLPRTAPSNTDPSGTAINAGISPRGPLSGLPQGDIAYPGCVGTLPYTNPALNAAFRAHLQAILQGNASPTFGLCYGSKTQDGILRGYVTVDTVSTCNILFPSQMLTGYDAVLTNENTLWGDYFYVNGAENFAQGDTLVHVESCGAAENGRPGSQYLTCFVPGDHTFYGRYDTATAIDSREPLPTTMGARYLNGGGFTGGTDFLVWREGGTQTTAVGYSCTNQGPSWYPLGSTQIVVFDETEQILTAETCPSGFDCDIDIAIPNEAQRVDIGTDIPTPFNFGWIYLNLQWSCPTCVSSVYGDDDDQMWLTTVMDASGRFSVGFSGLAFDNANTPTGIIP
jgi:hypothetical protein